MTDFMPRILKENLIQAIRQFNNYVEMRPIDRNNYVINLLKELLQESEKMQTEDCILMGELYEVRPYE